jgi:hypothetical protein
MHESMPDQRRSFDMASIQAVSLYGSWLWWHPKETRRTVDFQLFRHLTDRSILGALPPILSSQLIFYYVLTPTPVAVHCRPQQFNARLARAFDRTHLQEMYNDPMSGAMICRVIRKEHEQDLESVTLHEPPPPPPSVQDHEVETVILNDNITRKADALRWDREIEATLGSGSGCERWINGNPMKAQWELHQSGSTEMTAEFYAAIMAADTWC